MKACLLLAILAASHCHTAAEAQPPRRAPAATTRFSIDSTIRDLIANPAARAALDRHMPGISTHEHLAQFQNLTMRVLAASPHASIPASRVQALQSDLARIR